MPFFLLPHPLNKFMPFFFSRTPTTPLSFYLSLFRNKTEVKRKGALCIKQHNAGQSKELKTSFSINTRLVQQDERNLDKFK